MHRILRIRHEVPTTFNGKLIAMSTKTGKIVWQQQLTAGTNAPVVIDGDNLVTAATASMSSAAAGASTGVSLKAGMSVFNSTCASCHTLAAAGSTGTVGPNLDQLKPSDALVVKQVAVIDRSGMLAAPL